LFYQQHGVQKVVPATQPQSCIRRTLQLADLLNRGVFRVQ
jgi:hypothetical protein